MAASRRQADALRETEARREAEAAHEEVARREEAARREIRRQQMVANLNYDSEHEEPGEPRAQNWYVITKGRRTGIYKAW